MTPSSRTRVAIVEDHALTRAGLRTALEAAYDVVAEAADGLAGLDVIRRERPDVAVIDIGLPGMDGVALTKRVRAELPQTHVVIVTMIDLEDEVLAALGAGADAYCLKSSEPQRIVDAVAHRGRGRRLLRSEHRARRAGPLFRRQAERACGRRRSRRAKRRSFVSSPTATPMRKSPSSCTSASEPSKDTSAISWRSCRPRTARKRRSSPCARATFRA